MDTEDQVDEEKLAQHHQARPTRHETNMAESTKIR